jgi:hypothetical protein
MEYLAFEIISNIIDLHGVQLRESIKKSLGSKGHTGYVENLPNSVLVIINSYLYTEKESKIEEDIQKILLGKNKIMLDQHLKLDEELNSSETPDISKDNVIEIEKYTKENSNKWKNRYEIKKSKNHKSVSLDTLKSFEDRFEIKRSEASQESAWALQGAGKIFQISSRTQKHVSEQIRKRELIRTKMMIIEIDFDKPNISYQKPELLCVHSCIENSPYRNFDDEKMSGFIDQLTGIHIKIEDDIPTHIDSAKESRISKQEAKKAIEQITEEMDAIIKVISDRLKCIEEEK